MLSWIAIIIAALALLRIWQIYSLEKEKREFKQRNIARRLKKIREKQTQDKKSEKKDLKSGEN